MRRTLKHVEHVMLTRDKSKPAYSGSPCKHGWSNPFEGYQCIADAVINPAILLTEGFNPFNGSIEKLQLCCSR